MKKDPSGLWVPQAVGTAVGIGFGIYGAYANNTNPSFQTIVQSAAVGGAAGFASTLPVLGLNPFLSSAAVGGAGGFLGNLANQWLNPSSCSKKINWTSATIAGVTGATGGLGGRTMASSVTSLQGRPYFTEMGLNSASSASGGTLGGLLDAFYQSVYQGQ
jgi:hypothetical protein